MQKGGEDEKVQLNEDDYDGYVGSDWRSYFAAASGGGDVSNGPFNQHYCGGVFRTSGRVFSGIDDWSTKNDP